MKTCSICIEDKPLTEFFAFKNSRNSTTYTLSWCKPCNRKKNRDYHSANPARGMLAAAKRRAEAKGIPFTITVDDIVVPEFCPVLGFKLVPGGEGTQGPTRNSPSIDRIECALGYTKGNIIVVSMLANAIKTSGTPDEILKVGAFYKALEDEKNIKAS